METTFFFPLLLFEAAKALASLLACTLGACTPMDSFSHTQQRRGHSQAARTCSRVSA